MHFTVRFNNSYIYQIQSAQFYLIHSLVCIWACLFYIKFICLSICLSICLFTRLFIHLFFQGFDAWVNSHSDTKPSSNSSSFDKDKDKHREGDYDEEEDDITPHDPMEEDKMNIEDEEVNTVKEEKRKAKPVAGTFPRF